MGGGAREGREAQTCLTFPAQVKALRLESERVEEAGVSEATGSGQWPDYRPYRLWAKGFKLPVELTRDQALHNAGMRQTKGRGSKDDADADKHICLADASLSSYLRVWLGAGRDGRCETTHQDSLQ